MCNKLLLSLIVGAFFSTSLLAKYSKLPSSCHYIYSKSSGYISKKDVKCIVKLLAVQLNQNTPEKYGAITLNEVIPSNTTVIAKYVVTDRKKFDKGITKGSIKKAMKKVCRTRGLRPFFQEGLRYDHRFYSKSGKKIRSFTITKKTCGIN